MPLPTLLLDRRDRVPLALTLIPPFAVAARPGTATVAIAFWWLANTVSHQAVHRRFFRAAGCERVFSLWLSVLLVLPQRLWRQRHLAHHAGRPWRWRRDRQLTMEAVVVALVWLAAAFAVPGWTVRALLPGLAAGLLLCSLHGHFEHRGGTTSIHAAWWNVPFLNDGYHAEHHAAPGRHYRDLPHQAAGAVRTSCLPPVLRWCAVLHPANLLGALERAVLRRRWLRRAVLAAHRRALRAVLAAERAPRRVVIVGGGLFPRTAILLRELWPATELVVLDAAAAHLDIARGWLPPDVQLEHGVFTPGDLVPADLVVLPLAFVGDRERALVAPPAPLVLVHDWVWRRRPGKTCVVAWWLAKRVTLVVAANAGAPAVATA